MRHPVRIILLSAGAALGYGFAFHAMHDHRRDRMSFERHIAEVCVEAAQRSRAPSAPPNEPHE